MECFFLIVLGLPIASVVMSVVTHFKPIRSLLIGFHLLKIAFFTVMCCFPYFLFPEIAVDDIVYLYEDTRYWLWMSRAVASLISGLGFVLLFGACRSHFIECRRGTRLRFSIDAQPMHGFYAMVRHPMHLGAVIVLCGGVSFAGTPSWMPLLIVYTVAIIIITLLEDRAKRRSQSLLVVDYVQRVPRFIPTLAGLSRFWAGKSFVSSEMVGMVDLQVTPSVVPLDDDQVGVVVQPIKSAHVKQSDSSVIPLLNNEEGFSRPRSPRIHLDPDI